jgi:hypothetical protein
MRKSELNEDFLSCKSVISIKGEDQFEVRNSFVGPKERTPQFDKTGDLSSMNLNAGAISEIGIGLLKKEEEDPFVVSQGVSAVMLMS